MNALGGIAMQDVCAIHEVRVGRPLRRAEMVSVAALAFACVFHWSPIKYDRVGGQGAVRAHSRQLKKSPLQALGIQRRSSLFLWSRTSVLSLTPVSWRLITRRWSLRSVYGHKADEVSTRSSHRFPRAYSHSCRKFILLVRSSQCGGCVLCQLPIQGDVSVTLEGATRSARSTTIANRMVIDRVSFDTAAKTTNLVISSGSLHADLARLLGTPCHARLCFQPETGLQRTDVEMLSHIAHALCVGQLGRGEANGNEIASSYLQQAFTTIILQNVQHNYSNQLWSIPSDVLPARIKRAIDYMYANADQPLMLAQIAGAASLSVQGLQVGLMRHKSMSPMTFLRKVRLERVIGDLQNAGSPGGCEQIAARWGFDNFYRFTQAYTNTFGESPRQTRLKAR
ncbi:MAG: hypothetical protein CPDRYDRY_7020 [uncultured Paraburkholderia sp.]|nr:MAG: hypothetical protein CPDRYDRY_7020 [uncultured Paraburkholderia sp.]